MGNGKRKTIIKVIITIGIGIVSFLLLSKRITFNTLLSSSINSLRAQETDIQMLIVLAKDLSEALLKMSDISSEIMNSFDKTAPLLVIILSAVYLIQILLSYAAKIIFLLLIPLSCIRYLIFLIKKNSIQKRKIFKGILWITVLLFVLPVSVGISEKAEQTHAYNSVETLIDDSVAYHNDNSILNVPATQEEALRMIWQYLKVFGLLLITRVLFPLIFIAVYLRITQTILLKIPFISKQLELSEPLLIAESKKPENTSFDTVSEEVLPEVKEQKKITPKKYKRNRLIKHIVILIMLVIIVLGFKTGMINLPNNVKKVLTGTSVPLEYTEYTLQPGDNLEILKYKGFTVSTTGLESNEYGGHNLNISLSGDEYKVYVTDIFVDGVEVMPGEGKYILCNDPVRLFDEILKNYLNYPCVSDIMFTVCLSGSEKEIEGTYLKTENVRLYITDTECTAVDTSQLAEPLHTGKEIVIWNLGVGASYEVDNSVNYCLMENQSAYDVYIDDNRASIEGEIIVGESFSGYVRSGQIGLILFNKENTEKKENSPFRIVIEPEENKNNYSSLFGEYYRNLWLYRDNFGKVDIIYY